ncbi:hypothetical protein N7520_011224 [Penicillium odoratum]|uniref:uncharacterized protein n=1 Tax=Penicillium odoratum TaxID=1167516 RepID=UPI002546B1EF|nr:uncharacterized protein N7520_011224 [Penicillium odoratum]KAJ5746042.1 hypothetical protein N7520_011224 [Penicillium odoratum]
MTVTSETKEDYDLQEAWAGVCSTFAKTTKVDLTATPQYSVEEVLEQIRTRQDEDNEKDKKYKEVKNVISKTITFIGLLGGIVAQGASMVFAPSSLCFNALSYLVSTGAKYKRIFSSLAELFQKISDVLDRLQIYMSLPKKSVDIALRKILNEQLLCFVDICALSIKILQGHKVLIAIKVFAFSGDEGVSCQLARLETLVEQESQMRATLQFASQKESEQKIVESMERTKTIDTAVNKLLDADRKRDAYVQATTTLNDLDIALDKPSESWEMNQARLKGLMNEKIPGTGEWATEDSTYKSWVMMEQGSCSVLGIAGNEGCGKSFLLASIIQNLRENHSKKEGSLTLSSIAYYFFGQDPERNTLAQALKVLAWQIAKSNIVYCKDLSTIEMPPGNDIEMLWRSLFAKSYKNDSSFFLLLDGLEQVSKDEIRQFIRLLVDLTTISKNWGKLKLHILLSGQEEVLNRVMSHLGGEAAVINLTLKNGDDLQKFIESRMDRMEILSGSSEAVVALRCEVLESFRTFTKGDFVTAGLLLDEISKKQRPSEIRSLLAHSGDNRKDIMDRKIEQLNNTLSEDDITDLNALLTWLIFAAAPLTLGELEEVLLLKNDERSLRPLAKAILDQYSSLLRIEGKPKGAGENFPLDSRVLLVSESVKNLLIGTAGSKESADFKNEKASKTVNESEVRIVRRFLESVCDDNLFQRFGFDDFFTTRLDNNRTRLFVDKENAHVQILKICLEVLSSSSYSSEIQLLRAYTTKFFPYHLEQIDLSLVHPKDKTALGSNLVALFYDPEIIERWWMGNGLAVAKQREIWFYKDKHTDIVIKWLQDSAVTKNITDTQLRWVRSVVSKSEPDADILERIAQHMAHLWLTRTEPGIIATWYFPPVYGCFTKIEHRKDPSKRRPIRDPGTDDLKPSQILATANWVVRRFNDRESLEPREIYSVATSLVAYEKYDESIEQLKLAASLMSDNWEVEWDLAKAFAMKKEHARAIQILEAMIERVEKDNQSPKGNTVQLECIKEDLASWYEETGHEDQALAIYEGLFGEVPGDYHWVACILASMSKKSDSESTLRFLQLLKESLDEHTGLDRLTSCFLRLCESEKFNDALLTMAFNGTLLDFVLAGYQTAIATAETQFVEASTRTDKNKEWEMLAALCTKALLVYRHAGHRYMHLSHNTQDRIHAIEEWESIFDMEERCPIDNFEWVLIMVREKLASIYFIEAQNDVERSASYIVKLEQLAQANVSKDLTNGLKRDAAHLLAQYHILHGDVDKAKTALSAYLKVDLDILCDDDPLNDWEGYKCLEAHFRAVGMLDETIAAWSLITPHPDYSNDPGRPKGPVSYVCDGKCGTEWTYADDFYLCMICKICQFDQACLDRLRFGTLEVAGCSKEHQMLHIPPYDPVERATVGEGNVRVGKEIISVQAWIQRIRQDWGLEM